MKKIIPLALLLATVLPLAGCGEKKDETYKDSDFDGLYDSIDSLPNDNEYKYYFVDEDNLVTSNEISLKLDYHNFLTNDFSKNISQLSGLLISFGYEPWHSKWKFTKNSFNNDESDLNKGLVNFGFKDIKNYTISIDDNLIDPYDIAGVYLGNHLFVDENNKKYQIIAANVMGYPEDYAWYSNFDFGADSDGYYEIVGEEHPEWTNLKHHKGFDVSANRIYPKIINYGQEFKVKDAEQIYWVFGHSRSGSITNLLGKKLFDDGLRSICYAFNNPNTTTEEDEEVLNKYINIYNIRSSQDLLGMFPFENQGFDVYGKKFEYDLINNKDAKKAYHNTFNREFLGNNKETLDVFLDVAKTLFPTRESAYEFDDYYENEMDLTATTPEELEDELDEIQDDIDEARLNGITKFEAVENPDYDPSDEESAKYILKYNSKPIILFTCASSLIVKMLTSYTPILDLINTLGCIITYAKDIALRALAIITTSGISISIPCFAMPHTQETSAIGGCFAEPIE